MGEENYQNEYYDEWQGVPIFLSDNLPNSLADNLTLAPELNKGISKTMNLNSMMKRLLDASTKKLIKAGYIDGDLMLTEKGKLALFTILFAANKEELVKLAEEDLKEEKESN